MKVNATNIMTPIVFVLIAFLSIGLRLYHIQSPVADWHSWRQADTAAVARNYTKFGIDLLHPRYDDLSNIQSGKDNPMGYRMVEFPLYQVVGAGIAGILPTVPIEIILRVLTILASTITGLVLGVLILRNGNAISGICAAFLYAVLPYSIYYGRAILPDPHAVMWAVISVLCIDLAKERNRSRFIFILFGGVAGALALLTKPFAGFLFLPVVDLLFQRKKIIQTGIQLVLYGLVTAIPLFLWRIWIQHFPEGIPVYTWLLNGNNIRFKGSWFNWIFAERIGKLILGYWGMTLFGFGLQTLGDKGKKHILGWLLFGSLMYVTIVASGNVQHDYYQIMILPSLIATAGTGLGWLLKTKQNIFSYGLALVSVLFMCMFSWYIIRTYYWINRPDIVEAGQMANRILPKEAKVIAPYNGDTTFLYQTNRQGWPLGFDIDKKIQMGATHYVTVSPTDADLETKTLAKTYTVLVRNDRYAIIDLTKKQ